MIPIRAEKVKNENARKEQLTKKFGLGVCELFFKNCNMFPIKVSLRLHPAGVLYLTMRYTTLREAYNRYIET